MRYKLPLALLVLLTYGAFILTVSFYYWADMAYQSSQDMVSQDTEKSLELINTAIQLNPNEPIYYRGRARIYIASLVSLSGSVALKEQALNDMKHSYELNPLSLATVKNLISLYSFLAAKDLTLPPSSENVDSVYLEHAQSFYSKIKDISPNDVGMYTILAKYQKRLGLTKEYEYSVSRVDFLRPDLLQWHEAFK